MKYLSLDDLIIPEDRQRKDFAPSHIKELKSSILSKGLLHPIVVRNDGRTLVAGECRSRAIREIWDEFGKTIQDHMAHEAPHGKAHGFLCNGEAVPPRTIPAILISDLSVADLREAELEENLIRANLTWIEQATARTLIHELRTLQSSTHQSRSATAREISSISGKTPNAEVQNLHRAIEVMAFKDNPRVANAKSLKEAYRAVQDMHAANLRRELVERGMVQTEHRVLLGDCRKIMPELPAGSIDIILTDPPYGIKADGMKKTAGHFYDDSPENALAVCKAIIHEGFRLLKTRGIIFMFCDVEHFLELREYAKTQAYTAWRTPAIWYKGQDGHAPWGRAGFTRTYELFAFFTKGARELKGGGSDVKEFRRTSRSKRAHAAEKPVDLLTSLLSLAGDPGNVVLDPCCGSGPVLEACTAARMQGIGIELDPDYHARAVARLAGELEDEAGDADADADLTSGDEGVEEDVLA